ncbi:MAG: hypothetical protein AB1758_38455 [Candidatus Eremiobacterota bacterium]
MNDIQMGLKHTRPPWRHPVTAETKVARFEVVDGKPVPVKGDDDGGPEDVGELLSLGKAARETLLAKDETPMDEAPGRGEVSLKRSCALKGHKGIKVSQGTLSGETLEAVLMPRGADPLNGGVNLSSFEREGYRFLVTRWNDPDDQAISYQRTVVENPSGTLTLIDDRFDHTPKWGR